jgi:hypothetical protein
MSSSETQIVTLRNGNPKMVRFANYMTGQTDVVMTVNDNGQERACFP